MAESSIIIAICFSKEIIARRFPAISKSVSKENFLGRDLCFTKEVYSCILNSRIAISDLSTRLRRTPPFSLRSERSSLFSLWENIWKNFLGEKNEYIFLLLLRAFS